jgi:hypothetical protein
MNFATDTVYYDMNSGVFRDSRTIGYEFTNTGNSLLYINNRLVSPGETFLTFRALMIDLTLYRVEFRTNPAYPTPQTNSCQTVIFSQR